MVQVYFDGINFLFGFVVIGGNLNVGVFFFVVGFNVIFCECMYDCFFEIVYVFVYIGKEIVEIKNGVVYNLVGVMVGNIVFVVDFVKSEIVFV